MKSENLKIYQAPQITVVNLNSEQAILSTSTGEMGMDFGGGFGDEIPL